MKEIWKSIPGYEGIYEVSDLGRVKSLSREIKYKNRTAISKEKLLKQRVGPVGYYEVGLHNTNKRKTKNIHQLVAMAFLNHTPDGYKIIVDHINNIRTDNRLENLQVISQRENNSKDRKGGSSAFTGVNLCKQSNKYRAVIVINRKNFHLGRFDTEIEASEAYKKALTRINNGLNIIKKEYNYSSKYTGVSWMKSRNKWVSSITTNSKQIHLGYFINEQEAYEAYQSALTRKNNGLSAKADK